MKTLVLYIDENSTMEISHDELMNVLRRGMFEYQSCLTDKAGIDHKENKIPQVISAARYTICDINTSHKDFGSNTNSRFNALFDAFCYLEKAPKTVDF